MQTRLAARWIKKVIYKRTEFKKERKNEHLFHNNLHWVDGEDCTILLTVKAEAEAGDVTQYQHWTSERETALVDKVIR